MTGEELTWTLPALAVLWLWIQRDAWRRPVLLLLRLVALTSILGAVVLVLCGLWALG